MPFHFISTKAQLRCYASNELNHVHVKYQSI